MSLVGRRARLSLLLTRDGSMCKQHLRGLRATDMTVCQCGHHCLSVLVGRNQNQGYTSSDRNAARQDVSSII